MWLNHSSEDRFAEPKAMHVDSRLVPEVQPNDRVFVRVLLGEFDGVGAAIKPLPKVGLLDVHLKPNAAFTHRVPDGHISFVMMRSGKARTGETPMNHTTCVKFSDSGDSIEIFTDDEAASFLLGTGKPFNEPNLFGGPFVMSNNEQMHQTKLRYGRGEMGHLEPSPVFNHAH